MKKTLVLKTYDTIARASLDCDILRENGVDCFLSDENIVQLYPMFTSPFGGIKLNVFKEDSERATVLLDEYHTKNT